MHCTFSIKDFFSKCDQIHSFPRIWSHLLKKTLKENFIVCPARVIDRMFDWHRSCVFVVNFKHIKPWTLRSPIDRGLEKISKTNSQGGRNSRGVGKIWKI